ncbi:endonuclease/exonuclease/phosphatase family protein [Leifsonia sp. YAF41]|uniref:endonuclease/exonuclease/phosphatase family protein n=1 Tax=Leifsonia sp. YAF41 TaxID=3233086 RepID=UPI003F98A45E
MPDRVASPPATERMRAAARSRRAWARAIAVVAILFAGLLAIHPLIVGPFGTAIATALPWLGLIIPVLFIAALLTGRRRAWLVSMVPLLVWLFLIVPLVVPLSAASASEADASTLTVASQNVKAGSGTAAESAQTLVDEGADVISLVELDGAARDAASDALEATHPYSYAVGTVGLWSVYPIVNEQPLDLGLGWKRALAADIDTPDGLISVYVIHAASLRVGFQSDRDAMLAALADIVARDENDRVLVVGDFNAAVTDPSLTALRRVVSEPNQTSLSLGPTWPAANPLVRIDHIFESGLTPVHNEVVPAGDSDHLAVVTRFLL